MERENPPFDEVDDEDDAEDEAQEWVASTPPYDPCVMYTEEQIALGTL